MSPRSLRLQLQAVPILWVSLFALALLLALPVLSQSIVGDRPSAPIVLDGTALFEISDLENYTADSRAKQVNDHLAEVLEESDPSLQLEVTASGPELATIRLGKRHLLTVTENDVMPGEDPLEQAQVWQQKLKVALERGQRERSPQYQHWAMFQSLGVVAGAIAAHWGLRWVRLRWRRRRLRQGQHPNSRQELLKLGLTGLQVLIWGLTLFYLSEVFPQLRSRRYLFLEGLNDPLLMLGNQQEYGLLDLIILVALIIGLWFAVRYLTMLLKSQVLNILGLDRGLQEAIAILTQYILIFLGLMVILQVLGVDISALLIVGSALGVGIGFGLQNIVNNFISGIIILVNRPIEVGDFIHLGDWVGTVEHIGARSTKIITQDQVAIIVPNSNFLENEIVNWSHGSPVSRIHLPVGVAYGSNIAKIQQVLLDAVKHHPDVLAYPPPEVWFQGFGESSLDFEVLIWCCEPRQQARLKSDLNYRLEASLRQHHIEIPFPQRDLNVRSPQLDLLIELLIEKHTPSQSQLIVPNHIHPKPLENSSSSAIGSYPELDLTQNSPQHTPINLQALAAQMKGPGGVEVKDRRYRLNVYPDCFVGSEAVDWLMRTQKATRKEATRLGQLLYKEGLIQHVLDEHPFDDDYLFYQFCQAGEKHEQ